MIFFIVSLVAGFLTVLTPCVLPILPIVLGSSIVGGANSRKHALVVIGSLIVSVFVFTFVLKVSTAFIGVPEYVWRYLSAIIIAIFGLSLILPNLWSKISSSLFQKSNKLLNESYQSRTKWWGDIALGAALGPIFTTCSPTFFVILATVLPASLTEGIVYLVAYCAGLAAALILIAFLGQKVLLKIGALSDPQGIFKKVLGWVFVVLAVLIATGIIKKIETKILNAGFFDFTKIERSIGDLLGMDEALPATPEAPNNTSDNSTPTKPAAKKPSSNYPEFKYKEIVSPSGFVNTEAFALSDLVGKKVILLDIMTYSCINCQRTFPYLNAWYKAYKDQGLEIVAIHTPEFAFEKNIENVRKAALEFGLQFPIVLDNDYATWNAYGNRYWPRKYLIDIEGNVVYDHIGEGAYDKTEDKIVELLEERAQKLNTYVSEADVSVPAYSIFAKSPETYFGAWRNTNLGNGKAGVTGEVTYSLPDSPSRDKFYLGGLWNTAYEYAENIGAPAELVFKFEAKNVYMVAESGADMSERRIEIYLDGSMVSTEMIKDSKLYELLSLPTAGEHTLRIIFLDPKTRIYTFTFG